MLNYNTVTQQSTLYCALRSILRTKHHLHRPCLDSPLHHPLPPLTQPRARLHLAPIPPLGILCPTPQHLRRCSRSWPDIIIHVYWIGLLAPHRHFAAEDEVSQIRWNIGERIIGVDQAPAVQRAAVVCERVVLLE